MTHTNSNAADGIWALDVGGPGFPGMPVATVVNPPADEKFRYGRARTYGSDTSYGAQKILVKTCSTPEFYTVVVPLLFVGESDNFGSSSQLTAMNLDTGVSWPVLGGVRVREIHIKDDKVLSNGTPNFFDMYVLTQDGNLWHVYGDAYEQSGDNYVRTRLLLGGDFSLAVGKFHQYHNCLWAITQTGALYGKGSGAFGKVQLAPTLVEQLTAPANLIGASMQFLMTSDRHVSYRAWVDGVPGDTPIDGDAHAKMPTMIPGKNGELHIALAADGAVRVFNRTLFSSSMNGTEYFIAVDKEKPLVPISVNGASAAPAAGWLEIYDCPGPKSRDPATGPNDPDNPRLYPVPVVMRHGNGKIYAARTVPSAEWDGQYETETATLGLYVVSLGEPVLGLAVYDAQIIIIRADGSLGFWAASATGANPSSYEIVASASVTFPIELPAGAPVPVFTKLVSSEGVLCALDTLGNVWTTRDEGDCFEDATSAIFAQGPLKIMPSVWTWADVEVVDYNGGEQHSQPNNSVNGDWRAAIVLTRSTGEKYIRGWPTYATPGDTNSPGQICEFGLGTGIPGQVAHVSRRTIVTTTGRVFQFSDTHGFREQVISASPASWQIDGDGFEKDFVLVDDTRVYTNIAGDYPAVAVAYNAANERVVMMWGRNRNLMTMGWKPGEEKPCLSEYDFQPYVYESGASIEIYGLAQSDGVFMLNAVQFALENAKFDAFNNLIAGVPRLNDKDNRPIAADVYDVINYSQYAPRPWAITKISDAGTNLENMVMYPNRRVDHAGEALILTPYFNALPTSVPRVVSTEGKIVTNTEVVSISIPGFIISDVNLDRGLVGYASSYSGRYASWGVARDITPIGRAVGVSPPNGGYDYTGNRLMGCAPKPTNSVHKNYPRTLFESGRGSSSLRIFYGRVYGQYANGHAIFYTPVNHREIVDACGGVNSIGVGDVAIVTTDGSVYQGAPTATTNVWTKWPDRGRMVRVAGRQRYPDIVAVRGDGTLWSSRGYAQVGADAGWSHVEVSGVSGADSNSERVMAWVGIRGNRLFVWGATYFSGAPGTPVPSDPYSISPYSPTPVEIGVGRTWARVTDGGFAFTDDGDMFIVGRSSYLAHEFAGTVPDPANANILTQAPGKWLAGGATVDGAFADAARFVRADGAMVRRDTSNGYPYPWRISVERDWVDLINSAFGIRDSVAATRLTWSPP